MKLAWTKTSGSVLETFKYGAQPSQRIVPITLLACESIRFSFALRRWGRPPRETSPAA